MPAEPARTPRYKGLLLAGGTGSRLYPLSLVCSKQLVNVYDKPMIYYPLSTLMLAHLREILIVCDPATLPSYRRLLGDGSDLGLRLEYAVQQQPRGIAEALLIGADFLGDSSVVLILGDNLYHGYMDFLRGAMLANPGATIFAYHVRDPQRYGVVELDPQGQVLSLEEKPAVPRSSFAVPGIYVYDGEAVGLARQLAPSARGELEITDLNLEYLARGRLRVERIGRGFVWLDTGTPEALLDASNFVAAVEARQGLKIGCVEEVALRMGCIDAAQLAALAARMPRCQYRQYLERLDAELARHPTT